MGKKIKVLIIISVFLLLCIPGYFAARYFVFLQIEKRVANTLQSLSTQKIVVRYKSLKADPWKRNLVLTGLEMKFNDADSLCLPAFMADKVEVNGIKLVSLFAGELSLDTILLHHPRINIKPNYKIPQQRQDGAFFKSIQIDLFLIDSGLVTIMDSTSCDNLADIQFNANAKNIWAEHKDTIRYSWNMGEAVVSNVKAKFPSYYYAFSLKQFIFNQDKNYLKLDSIQIVPLYTREEFAKKAGDQVDQFNCTIPFITVNGITAKDSSYRFNKIRMGFHLEAYRDKRYLRKLNKATALPVQFLQNLPFQLQVDSVSIDSSYVSYEEFPEAGDKPGKLEFNNVNAIISNISNCSTADATMNVQALFMKTGDLNATLTFPNDAEKPYWASGSLTHFSMPEINSMLTPLEHAKIESGELQEMKFQFQYNAYRSDGEVQLLYTNLQVYRLRKNPAKTINKFISFLLNTAVRNNMDRNDKKIKRTGTIQMYRNPQQGIFNYWWKSIFSGVESQFGLNRIIETNGLKKAHPKQKHKHSK